MTAKSTEKMKKRADKDDRRFSQGPLLKASSQSCAAVRHRQRLSVCLRNEDRETLTSLADPPPPLRPPRPLLANTTDKWTDAMHQRFTGQRVHEAHTLGSAPAVRELLSFFYAFL